MAKIQPSLSEYLSDVLGASLELKPSDATGALPLVYTSTYSFEEGALLGTDCLFAFVKDGAQIKPSTYKAHDTFLSGKVDRPVVFVIPELDAVRRKRLIDYRVSFIVIGNQMYLPGVGVDLREHYRKQKRSPEDKDHLTASAQQILILFLNQPTCPSSTKSVAEALGISPKTAGRAFSQLESPGHIQTFRDTYGLPNLSVSPAVRETWEHFLPRLRSPVLRREFIELDSTRQDRLGAGLSALAAQTMLAEPKTPVIASRKPIEAVPGLDGEPGSVAVEIWRYEPRGTVYDSAYVDPFSLYLSLKDDPDERVQAALRELMESTFARLEEAAKT